MVKEIDMSSFGVENPEHIGNIPAGHERDEEMSRRTDTLQQRAEEKADANEIGAIPHDHDALRPDRNREIQNHIHKDHLAIGTDHPIYVAKWVNWKNLEGQMVWKAKSDGWMTASVKEFPEAAHLRKEDGTIRVADVILMFIPKEVHAQLVQREKRKRQRQQFGVEQEIHDMAERNPHVFAGAATPELGVTGNLSPTAQKKIAQFNTRGAGRVAINRIGDMMKKGPIPGVPLK